MLTRLYVDNFRCLVNFELKLDRVALLLGANGSGKTTVFDLLRRLQRFLLGESSARITFPINSLNRWQTRLHQTVELELRIDRVSYRYSLSVYHDPVMRRPVVAQESLSVEGQPIFLAQGGKARLQQPDGSLGNEFPFDPVQSVVGSFLPSEANPSLQRFRDEIEKFVVAAIQPANIRSNSEEEVRVPTRYMRDFVDWYRYLSQEYQGSILSLNQELRAVLPGFHSFSLKEAGEKVREMRALFQTEGTDGSRVTYRFSELSDGQRVLIVLYTLLYGLEERGAYLFLDEPENFVALREVQPWLTSLYDRVGGGIKQAVLISHHPETIDYFGTTDGRWFDRAPNGPVRVSELPPAGLDSPLSLSETIARGWEK